MQDMSKALGRSDKYQDLEEADHYQSIQGWRDIEDWPGKRPEEEHTLLC